MRKVFIRFLVAIPLCIAWHVAAMAQASSPPDENAADVAVQPGAIKALDDMAAYLRTLIDFKIVADETRDDVLEDGQKVEIHGTSTYLVRVPNKMKLEVNSDEQWRIYYYDGKTVTQYAPSLSVYSVFDAGATITDTLDLAETQYGIKLPLSDLFYWGTEKVQVQPTSAFFVGESRIDDKRCDHYAYRAEGVDFEVWIAKAGDPLPCRLVITNTEDPARPEYGATISWDLDPLLADSMFSFSPQEGVDRIEQTAGVEQDTGSGE